MNPLAFLATATLLLYPALSVAQEAATQKKKLCFIGHKTSHGFGAHEYAAGNRLIGEWLEKAYPGQIEAVYSVNWPEDPDHFFAGADTVVFFCTGGGGHLVNKHVPEFDKVMRTGAGLVCLHYAVEVPIGSSAKGMLNWMGGYFEKNWSVNPHWVAEFKSFTDHPAANGIKPFEMDDEWYFHMRFRGNMEGITPILSAVAPESTMKRKDGPHSGNPTVRKAVAAGEPQHVAWAYQRGEDYKHGRGYGFTGLHYHWNWLDENFRKTVLNGVAWTAKLPIPEDGVPSPKPTREALEANALKYGGEQNRKKKETSVPKPAAANLIARKGIKPLYQSSVLVNKLTKGHRVDFDIPLPEGSKHLVLMATDGGDGFSFDWATWGEPRLIMADGSETKLTELEWRSASTGWGQVRKNQNAGGGELKLLGKPVSYGIGTHANSVITFVLPKGAKRFKGFAALDDGGTSQNGGNANSSIQFAVFNADPGPLTENEYVKRTSASGREPADAIPSLDVHPELDVQLFASEPMILSPSSIDVDHRGRVWVCEVVNYRRNQGKRPDGKADRILILEDKDGDAKADEAKVFYQGHDVDSAHGICVLGDRVIVSAGDDIFSLIDENGDDKADRKELLFTKIGGKQHDHGIHAVHFGPDGRLYFNFGNAGKQLCDKNGELITDLSGKEIRAGNLPYQEGMVFRCELDGSKVETLGWNFRNNWEVCVDSFGSLWQSDNDDDGNKAVRINYVMEFGNYGYKDETTRAGWRDTRIGIEEEIPLRHWHLNDPGVVPNLLQTGAGSPTGICVYEGDQLPKLFWGQAIHCDAGPNVVRAYPASPEGAGYSATIENILSSTRDRWFRPSDVCVAPDGSLLVADWYDPGVGGHGMGDIERGRLFRVSAKGNSSYQPPRYDFKSVEGSIEALKSPNMAARYLAFSALLEKGEAAKEGLAALFEDRTSSPHHRARALWLLARFDPAAADRALGDQDPMIRITALRAIRQVSDNDESRVLAAVSELVDDSDARVRAESAIALRFFESDRANQLWAELAARHQSGDRWSTEALGIGADLHWDERIEALADLDGDLLWRSRGSTTPSRLAEAVLEQTDPNLYRPLLRSFDFQPHDEARKAAYRRLFLEGETEPALFAAGRLGPEAIQGIENGQKRLDTLIAPIRGTAEFVNLAAGLNLTDFPEEMGNFIASQPDSQEAVTAARLLLKRRGDLVGMLRDPKQLDRARAITIALGRTNDRAAGDLLAAELQRPETSSALKIDQVNAMAVSQNNARELLKLAEKGALEDALKPVAALALARSPDGKLRAAAAQILPVPKAIGADSLPPLAELAKKKGDASKGPDLFTKATCATCHKVKGQGIDFGPDLTEIGNKLSREAMFEAILYPSAAISHGFHGVTVTLKNGTQGLGYVTGETDQALTLRQAGGVSQEYPLTDIAKREELDQSLMPPGLAAVIGEQGLIDLVDYLQSLK